MYISSFKGNAAHEFYGFFSHLIKFRSILNLTIVNNKLAELWRTVWRVVADKKGVLSHYLIQWTLQSEPHKFYKILNNIVVIKLTAGL